MNIKKYTKLTLFTLNPKNRKKLTEREREVLLYVFFGVLTTVISLISYFLFRWIFAELTTSTAPPVVISWICAVTFAYITNKIFVFKSKRDNTKSAVVEFFSFYGARIFTLLVDLLLMFLLVDLTGIKNGLYEFFARAAVGCVVLVLNYLLSKLFVFKKR